ncbi:MAG: hypothetical protein NTW79_01760 [Candidatus Berkelbacteria bacterium]|nr:hypothetical protein [Candidatus Berkelbacteria bacterium]
MIIMEEEIITDVGCQRATGLYRDVAAGNKDILVLALIEKHREATTHDENCFTQDPRPE